MSSELPGALFQEGMMMLGVVGTPVFAALLVVGLLVGIFQATTQINDPAIGALPRLGITALVLMLLGGWMLERMAAFMGSALTRMSGG